jgi:hypothetical protein
MLSSERRELKPIIIDPQEPGPWRALLEKAGIKPIPAGGILFYRVPLAALASFRNSNGGEGSGNFIRGADQRRGSVCE